MARDSVCFASCPARVGSAILEHSHKEKRGLSRVQQAGPAQAHSALNYRTVSGRHGGHGGHHDGLLRRRGRSLQRGAGGSHQRPDHQHLCRPGHRGRGGVRPVHRRPKPGAGQPGSQPTSVYRHRRCPGDHGSGAFLQGRAAGPAVRPSGAGGDGGGRHLLCHLRPLLSLHRRLQRLRRPCCGPWATPRPPCASPPT